MNFIDAVNNMIAGKRMVRTSWSGHYVSILNNQDYIWNLPTANAGDKPTITAYMASVDDILASDWIVKIN